MKVYVAGSVVERHARAIPCIKRLRDAGITITCDWTVDVVESSPDKSDTLIPEEKRVAIAKKDVRAIMDADCVLHLAPDERGASGCWTEFGIALGLNCPIIISGKMAKRTVFASLARNGFVGEDTLVCDEQACAYIITLHEGRVT